MDASSEVGRLAYRTGEFTKVSHTFIKHEIRYLRALGYDRLSGSIRRPRLAKLNGEEKREIHRETLYPLAAAKGLLLPFQAHLGWMLRAPGRYVSALCLALTVRDLGAQSLLYRVFYFLEAGLKLMATQVSVATRFGSVRGLIGPPDDIPSLAGAIHSLVFNLSLRHRMGAAEVARFGALLDVYAGNPVEQPHLQPVVCRHQPDRPRRRAAQ